MDLSNKKIGFAVTGSFCTISKAIKQMIIIKSMGASLYPIVSENVRKTSTRFFDKDELAEKIEIVCDREVIDSIVKAEPIGPLGMLDALLVAPCTGNTLAKIANGITDSCVCMAVKAQLRNQKPVVMAISTNDGLKGSAKNIAAVLNSNNIYMVPFGQDDFEKKPNSIVADMDKIPKTLQYALEGKQIQPILC